MPTQYPETIIDVEQDPAIKTKTVNTTENVIIITTDKEVVVNTYEDVTEQNFITNIIQDESPAGADGALQFKMGANLAADSNLTFDVYSKILSVGGVSTDLMLYANGSPWVFAANSLPGGNSGQIQFNDAGELKGATTLSYSGTTLSVGNVENLRIAGGTAGQVLTTNGNGVLSFTSVTGSVAVLAGGNTQVQFNNNGVIGANSAFTYNETTGVLSAPILSGQGSALSNIAGANIVGAVANADYATNAGNAATVLGSGVSGEVQTANTVSNPIQTDITQVGTLTGLEVSGNVVITKIQSASVLDISTNNGLFSWTLDDDGSTVLPGSLLFPATNGQISSTESDGLSINGGTVSVGTELVHSPVKIQTADQDGTWQWTFGTDGNLTLPIGGDIKDSNGNSVFGSVTSEITNTEPSSPSIANPSTYSVSVGTDGVITMVTARGDIEFGAQPEIGGPQHLHIMRPAGQEGATDLYFGDDYNYVRMPGSYGPGTQGVEIGSSYGQGAVSVWKFGTDGDLVLPVGKTIRDTSGTDLLASGDPGGGTTLPSNASGYLVNDGSGNLSWAAGDGTFSGNYDDLTNKPTSRQTVSAGSGPGGNNQTDSLVLAGLNPVTDIPSTWGGDLILQGGVGGSNGDLYGEVRIKSGTIGSNYEWHFTSDKKIKLPTGGDIVDSTGTSVLGGGFSGSYTDLTDKPTIPADVSDLTDTTNLLGGGGTTLPADASGYLNNNGSGTLTWVAGNPAGSGMLPYTDVVVFSNTVAGDWTSFTLSGTMDSFNDYQNNVATITLSSQTALGVQAVSNTKTLWINDSKVDSNDYMVIEFPPSPTVGDVFNITTSSVQTTVNAGSFVVGQTYTILTTGDTSWTSIGSPYSGVGATFVATGIGSGTGTATTPAGAKKIIYKPAAGQRARIFPQGQTASLWFGTGGTYDFMYSDSAASNSGMLLTFVFAGAIDGIPSWYQVYF